LTGFGAMKHLRMLEEACLATTPGSLRYSQAG